MQDALNEGLVIGLGVYRERALSVVGRLLCSLGCKEGAVRLAEDGEIIVADWRIRLGADCIAEIRMGIGAMLLKAINRCKIAAARPGASWLDGGSGAPALTEAERMECVRLADTVSCRALEA